MVVIIDEFGIVRRDVVMSNSRMMRLAHSYLAWLYRCSESVPRVVVAVVACFEPHLVVVSVVMIFELVAQSSVRLVSFVLESCSNVAMLRNVRWLLLGELDIFRVWILHFVACAFGVDCRGDRCANPLDAIRLDKVDKRDDLGGLELS